MVQSGRSNDRGNNAWLMHQPGQRNLGVAHAARLGNARHLIHNREIVRRIDSLKMLPN